MQSKTCSGEVGRGNPSSVRLGQVRSVSLQGHAQALQCLMLFKYTQEGQADKVNWWAFLLYYESSLSCNPLACFDGLKRHRMEV
jgi:hypothetical protein